jgi:hypothetical protein
MSTDSQIYFSYAWGDENEQGESREKIVNELYQSLKRDHYKVIRDKNDIEYKGFISEFMRRIGEGKCVVVVISKKYLKSPYCMFELYEIARIQILIRLFSGIRSSQSWLNLLILLIPR